MEGIKQFEEELAAIVQSKPPVSSRSIEALVATAMKWYKYYKHIVQSLEKFLIKARAEYKLPGVYVLDAIVRASRHKHGEQDLYGPRFAKHLEQMFRSLFSLDADELRAEEIREVVRRWQKSNIFPSDVSTLLLSPYVPLCIFPSPFAISSRLPHHMPYAHLPSSSLPTLEQLCETILKMSIKESTILTTIAGGSSPGAEPNGDAAARGALRVPVAVDDFDYGDDEDHADHIEKVRRRRLEDEKRAQDAANPSNSTETRVAGTSAPAPFFTAPPPSASGLLDSLAPAEISSLLSKLLPLASTLPPLPTAAPSAPAPYTQAPQPAFSHSDPLAPASNHMQAQIDNRGSALSRPGQAQGYQDPRPAHGGPDPYRRERWDDYPPSREEYPPPPPAAEYSRDRDFQSRDFPPPPRGKPELPLHCPPGHLRVLSTTVWIGGIQERDAEYLKSEVYKLTGVKSMQNSLERHCSFVQFNSRDEAETALDILTNTFQAGKELKVKRNPNKNKICARKNLRQHMYNRSYLQPFCVSAFQGALGSWARSEGSEYGVLELEERYTQLLLSSHIHFSYSHPSRPHHQ
eukprot:m.237709 g.237709  ORF g.237709 m.237709 type:complete len:575 (+) comp54335_c0_seq4:45-1769(+)